MKAFRERMVRGMMGVLIGFAVIFIIFVSAFEIACYSDYGFYQKEYEKYDVNNKTSIVNMDMDELMKVTKEMMQYLCGNREELVIYAQVDGTEKEMFHTIEKSHMADVRDLFVAALQQRWICVGIIVVSVLLLYVTYGFRKTVETVCRGVEWTILCLAVIATAITVAAYIDFDSVFYLMHRMLFNNNNWLLDESTSRLINMLPEGFFIDMGIRIAIIFIFINFFILSLAFWIKRGMIKRNRKNISGGTYEQS